MKSCDVFSHASAAANRPRLPWRFLASHKPNGTIFLHASLLVPFADRHLPKLNSRFVLVTDGVEVAPAKAVDAILSHPRLVRWLSMNRPADASQAITPVSLGIDHQTLLGAEADDRGPLAVEALLEEARRGAPALAERSNRAFCRCQQIAGKLDPNVPTFSTTQTSGDGDLGAHAQSGATVSPNGTGGDSHLHYKAILLGAPPVISGPTVNRLLARLPHIAVARWEDLTPDLLAAKLVEIRASRYDFAPLLLSYWQNVIAGRPVGELVMDYQTFMDTPLAALKWSYQEATEP